MTMHEEWTDKLSDYIDGELTAEERRGVAAHVAQCAECARTLDELRVVVARAQAATPVEPSIDLWSGIAERIAASERSPRLIKGPWFSTRFSFTMPQIAAASVLLALLSGWAALRFLPQYGGAGNAGSASSADLQVRPAGAGDTDAQVRSGSADVVSAAVSEDAEYDAAVAELERALQDGRGRLDPTTVKVVEDNLAIINQAVDEAQTALAEDPANGYLSGYLVETRRRKLDLLRQAASLTEEAN